MDLKEEEKLVKQAQKISGKQKERTKPTEENKPFAKLYSHYHPLIKRFFLSRVSDPTQAEDLTSEVFVKTLEGLDSFRWQGVSFSYWIYKIARNTLVDFYRKSSREKNKVSADDVKTGLKDGEKSALENLISQERSNLAEKLMRTLNEKEAVVVYMKFYEGYTNRAISNLTGLSETNVGTIVYRALRRMRDNLRA